MTKSKPLCITFTNYTWEKHLKTYDGENRSKFIEEMFLRGIDTYDPTEKSAKIEVINLIEINREQIANIGKLKALNANLQKKLENRREGKEIPRLTKDMIEWLEHKKERYQQLIQHPPSEYMINSEGAMTKTFFIKQNRRFFNRDFSTKVSIEVFEELIKIGGRN